MATPPSSPTPAPPEPATEPPSPSTLADGAASGTLPAAEAFAVHYPGYPSSPARAARTLGGLPAIAKVRSSDPSARLELRFRPEDPYCHPAFGESRASTGLVLRLSRRKGAAPPRAEVVARVRTAYHFEGMADFQHVVPVHAAQVRKRKWSNSQNDNGHLGSDTTRHQETDDGDVMMLVPPLFSVKDRPTKIALLPSSNAVSKSMHRGVVQERWEMKVGPTLALPFNIQVVPGKINWEDHVRKNSVDWDWQMAVCKLFDERPVWPRQSLYERLQDDGVHVSQNQFKRLLFRAGYYFSTGPFGKFWIRRGYDPRKDPDSRISQKWAEMCKLEVMPSQSFIFLQLFELKDDFIQEEIRKPSYQSICSHFTGWFSKPMMKTLRLQVSIRFLTLLPSEEAKSLLRNAHELIERSKKQEALWRSERSKEDKHVDEEAPATHTGTEDQVGLNKSDSEDVDDEEEEEESDGYESPPMMPSVKASPMDTSKKCCAAFHCRKMAKTDQLMPLMLMVVMGSLKFSNNPVTMSLMVRLVFMGVNLPQLQFCKHIDQMHSNTVVVELCYAVRKSLDSCCLPARYNLQFSGGAGRKKKSIWYSFSGYLGLRIGARPSTTHSQFVGVEC
ncbi:transcription factor tau subunit sfc1-like isoform X4 [Panicum virgatum]|uniref:transcription factor tau subunit sfc1-like isoform X4 n=1 Tax=Panicum virgatum TaxID=38727 RepID=UPI0019D5E190|nr:transcription factor tau subunit sfc1-like isoform X4 [Panicum virgatum]